MGALHCGVLLLRFFQFVILSRSVIALYAIPKRCQETRNVIKFEKRLTFTDGVETRATGAKGGSIKTDDLSLLGKRFQPSQGTRAETRAAQS